MRGSSTSKIIKFFSNQTILKTILLITLPLVLAETSKLAQVQNGARNLPSSQTSVRIRGTIGQARKSFTRYNGPSTNQDRIRNELNHVHLLHFNDPTVPGEYTKLLTGGKLDAAFKPRRKLKILIHGFTQNNSTTFPRDIKNAYLQILNATYGKIEPFNLLVVDWSRLAGGEVALSKITLLVYHEAVKNIQIVGGYLAEFLLNLKKLQILESFHDVHIIGFSLGAQLGGFVGQKIFAQTQERIGRITGLDPAGPLFYGRSSTHKLDAADATFVDIIHTNGGQLGFSMVMGHVDIFPNGGRFQPGCENDWTGRCSHDQAHILYTKSIYDANAFTACKCDSWTNFSNCTQNCEAKVWLGESCSPAARGEYYLKTK